MKKPDLPYLICQKQGGREYWYFRRHGKATRLPDPSEDGFLTAYEDVKRGKTRRAGKRTFKALINDYTTHPNFAELKPRTQTDYSKVMDYLLDVVGDDDPARMITRDVYEAQMANTHRKRFANEVVSMLSRLFTHALKIGWATNNPALGVARLKTGDGHKPWPDDLVERYAQKAQGVDRLIFELGIGTGQRIQDILDMKWADVEGDGINVTQNKTGVELYIPFTARLSEYMATVKKTGFHIVTTSHGKPMHYNTAEQRYRRVRDAVGGKGYVMHGWRYTAAHHLAQAGCTDSEIAAITGHKSLEMVAKYSRKHGQRQQAKNAQGKRDLK